MIVSSVIAATRRNYNNEDNYYIHHLAYIPLLQRQLLKTIDEKRRDLVVLAKVGVICSASNS